MNSNPFLLADAQYRVLCRNFVKKRRQVRSPITKERYYSVLRLFRRWMIKHGHTGLNEEIVKAWMLDCSQKKAIETCGMEVLVITHFLDYLVLRKLCRENPLSTLYLQHRARGYRGMVRALKETGSISALDNLADIPFSGALGFHFTDYLNHLGALGKSLKIQSWLLKTFDRYLRQRNISDLKQVDTSVVTAWNDWLGQTSEYQKCRRLLGLKKFFDFLAAQGRILVSPLPQVLTHHHRALSPYVFSREEISHILTVAEKLPDHLLMPYRGATYRMVFLSLYTLGLRISEALNLKLADIDFVQDSVTVRDTKFYKGRVLPFGPRYKSALQRYINGHPLLISASAEDFLFPTRSCQAGRRPRLSKSSCYQLLCRVLKEMSITPPPATQSPKLHSFRHSFAVHRLENWMREGADISAKLTLLSAFLGHTTIANTQVYLSMTPERLAMIGERFENAFGMLPQTEEIHP